MFNSSESLLDILVSLKTRIRFHKWYFLKRLVNDHRLTLTWLFNGLLLKEHSAFSMYFCIYLLSLLKKAYNKSGRSSTMVSFPSLQKTSFTAQSAFCKLSWENWFNEWKGRLNGGVNGEESEWVHLSLVVTEWKFSNMIYPFSCTVSRHLPGRFLNIKHWEVC